MPYVESHGTNIYFEDDGTGPAIVFAHGAGGNTAIWYQQVAHFAARGYRCITFDHRGFARTQAADDTLTPVHFRDDVLAILDALDIARAHLVGQSMGGWTVLRTTLDAPERVLSLTMSATPGGLPNDQPTPAARGLLQSSERAGQGILATMARASMANAAHMRLYRAISDFNTDFSMAKLGTLGAAAHRIPRERLQEIQVPVLFVAGAEDPLFPADLLETYIPHCRNGRLVVVENAGHSPYFEQPEPFNRILFEHISSI